MLDFMYGENLSLTVDSAVPLMELARRFQLPALGASKKLGAHLNSFLNNPESALMILAHALDLKLEKWRKLRSRSWPGTLVGAMGC